MSKEFDILSAALDEAIADAKSGNKILKSETISIEIEPLVDYSADTIKEIRKSTGLTQSLFAKWLGVSTRTVEAWETGRNKPSGPSSRLLSLLQKNKLSIAY
ncbi:helix-turn-helix domain-containing protein [Schwartzia succinivorans]|jgi:putative transcriptional regulator|uniref:Putative transcriptional regulator n=1 Tax=Schwartzia succinivorans DSM 10502 TaxID=1123243 RepID=A0A1M4UI23_9FIRM|nr:helix-turn-helix domain-containing protein [Schwartzia succinivorans]SHE56213.1 putative transcriptional regulator [Schwartzia succinivorans DSM 10502]